MEYTPEKISWLKSNEVFVFGSNFAGCHGGGAARTAWSKFGAVWGQGVGLYGQSYAIPTMQGNVETIKPYVDEFIDFAKAHPDLKFYVTCLYCGFEGYAIPMIASLFRDALKIVNIILPQEYAETLIDEMGKEHPLEPSWDSHRDFLDEYNRLKYDHRTYDRIKELRCLEFQNTIEIVNQGWYITETGKIVITPDDVQMRKNTKFYSYKERIYSSKFYSDPTIIQVIEKDCLDVATGMIAEGYNPAVLNMASRRNPGGGVTTGAGAQEESLFRRTNLFRSLYQFAPYASQYGLEKSDRQYPMNRDYGGIYTPDTTLFRESENEGYRLMENPVQISFISVAGLNRPYLINGDKAVIPHLVYTIKNKIRTILTIGIEHKHDSLVLGALGCGAFGNPPGHIAYLFHEVLNEPEFKNRFRRIVFAIIDDKNTRKSHNPKGNFLPFKEVFCDNIVNDPGYKVESYDDYISSPEFHTYLATVLCGNRFAPNRNLTWLLYDNGVLEISGIGEIPDYINHWFVYDVCDRMRQAPWVGCGENSGIMPTRLIVREGITRIGENAFESFGCLKKVLLPNSLQSLGKEAFFDCFNIEMINIPPNLKIENFDIAELPLYYQGKYIIEDGIMRQK